jgi:hypothetical protein
MGLFSRAKETVSEVTEAIVEMHNASQLGQAIGKEAYRQGLQPGDMEWSTVETLAQQQNIRHHRESVGEQLKESIDEGYADAEEDAHPKRWRFW